MWLILIINFPLGELSTYQIQKKMFHKTLPVTSDFMKIRNHMNRLQIIPELTAKVIKEPTTINWLALAEAIGVRLTIFNHCRGNDVFQLLVSQFKDIKWLEVEPQEIKESLSPLEKHLSKRYAS